MFCKFIKLKKPVFNRTYKFSQIVISNNDDKKKKKKEEKHADVVVVASVVLRIYLHRLISICSNCEPDRTRRKLDYMWKGPSIKQRNVLCFRNNQKSFLPAINFS